jgi:hypothetical protein
MFDCDESEDKFQNEFQSYSAKETRLVIAISSAQDFLKSRLKSTYTTNANLCITYQLASV